MEKLAWPGIALTPLKTATNEFSGAWLLVNDTRRYGSSIYQLIYGARFLQDDLPRAHFRRFSCARASPHSSPRHGSVDRSTQRLSGRKKLSETDTET